MTLRSIADISLDLDNKWAYLRTHGDESWSEYPSYLPYVVPKILEILRGVSLKITVFVIGQDAEREENRECLQEIVADEHEIANHSFNHFPWLQKLTRIQLTEEFERTEQALGALTSRPIVGFRAPGYSLTGDVLELMAERGYLYDCSTLPTYLGPAARAYYLLKSSFSKEEAEDRKDLFGQFGDGFRSLKPYYWSTKDGEILELPVSTIPIFRIPFHFSYLHYISQLTTPGCARLYLAFALRMCRLTNTSPSLLLHPLDFLGVDEVPELSFFPGMKLRGEPKREFMRSALQKYSSTFEVLTMQQRAERLEPRKDRLRRVIKLPYR